MWNNPSICEPGTHVPTAGVSQCMGCHGTVRVTIHQPSGVWAIRSHSRLTLAGGAGMGDHCRAPMMVVRPMEGLNRGRVRYSGLLLPLLHGRRSQASCCGNLGRGPFRRSDATHKDTYLTADRGGGAKKGGKFKKNDKKYFHMLSPLRPSPIHPPTHPIPSTHCDNQSPSPHLPPPSPQPKPDCAVLGPRVLLVEIKHVTDTLWLR